MTTDTLMRVRRCVAEVLALDVEKVTADRRLMQDLGAESLDLVELMFMIEREFGLRISRDDLSLSSQLGLPDGEIHRDDVLTPKALAMLRERHPDAHGLLQEGMTRRHLAALLTVGEMAKSVERRLGTG